MRITNVRPHSFRGPFQHSMRIRKISLLKWRPNSAHFVCSTANADATNERAQTSLTSHANRNLQQYRLPPLSVTGCELRPPQWSESADKLGDGKNLPRGRNPGQALAMCDYDMYLTSNMREPINLALIRRLPGLRRGQLDKQDRPSSKQPYETP